MILYYVVASVFKSNLIVHNLLIFSLFTTFAACIIYRYIHINAVNIKIINLLYHTQSTLQENVDPIVIVGDNICMSFRYYLECGIYEYLIKDKLHSDKNIKCICSISLAYTGNSKVLV